MSRQLHFCPQVVVLRTCVLAQFRMARRHRPCTRPCCYGPSPQFIGGRPIHGTSPKLLSSRRWSTFAIHRAAGLLWPSSDLVTCLVSRISPSCNESGTPLSARALTPPPAVLSPVPSPQLPACTTLSHTSSKPSPGDSSGSQQTASNQKAATQQQQQQ